MLRVLMLVVVLAVLLLGVSIGYFNAQAVRFDYLFGALEAPLIALLIGAFSVAVLITLLAAAGRILRLKSEIRSLRKQLDKHEAELRNLRNLPVGPGQ
jgi:lipopolysaccharide assembly protein A